MILKELEIQGFKSFPDKVRIQIQTGITAVVGPNGSGKSNISDAIRWVLGENSSKQLRGTGKMEDVIFGGTRMRNPMGFASVKLVFDNSDHRVDVESDQVTVGRKFYRSGVSEYSINGQQVRQKDIIDIFRNTGLGRDGYSAIGQGRIAEIVGAKSNERREIFEEASGIARYRDRKNEAERNLKAAEENLVRLRDILLELENRVGPLEKESRKAERYLSLLADRKKLEVTLWVEKIKKALENTRLQQRKLEAAQADYDRLSEEIKVLDESTEALRREGEHLISANERLDGDITRLQGNKADIQQKIALLGKDIEYLLQQITELKQAMEKSSLQDAESEQEAEKLRQKEEEARLQSEEIDGKIEILISELQVLSDRSAGADEQKVKTEQVLAELTEQETKEKVAGAAAQSNLDATADRLEALKGRIEETRNDVERNTAEEEKTGAYCSQLEMRSKQLQNICTGLSLKLQSRSKALDEADEAERKVSRELDMLHQKLSVLTDMERNMEGYYGSVKAVMKAAQARRLTGIVGPLASALKAKPGYEAALETALGSRLQKDIIVDCEESAQKGIYFLKAEKAGIATFLPLDVCKRNFTGLPKLPAGIYAVQAVECEPRYNGLVAWILGNTVIAGDLKEASYIAHQTGFSSKIVTLDGQQIDRGGSYTGGSKSKSFGLFSRKKEIDELKTRIQTLTEEENTAQEKTDRVRAELDKIQADINASQSEWQTVKEDLAGAKAELDLLTGHIKQGRSAIELLLAEQEVLIGTLDTEQKKLAEVQASLSECEEKIKQYSELLKNLDGSSSEFLDKRSELNEKITELQLQKLALEKDRERYASDAAARDKAVENAASYRAELEGNCAEMDARITGLREKIAEHTRDAAEIDAAVEKLLNEREQNVERRMTLAQKEKAVSQNSKDTFEQREQCSLEIGRLKERILTGEAEYEQTVGRLWEEYELTPQTAAGECVEFESITELGKKVGDIRAAMKSLGHVNVNAIDEFQEVSARYIEQKKQIADIDGSRLQLIKMIGELSDEMSTLFAENFKKINENFARIFTELFGGGTASLELTDENNILESGIEIKVEPPGKVIRNLSALSGGEQSLVAISIYFAILAVNPSPFCILDEIEAALDDVNVVRYAQYLRRISDKTQFIVITHRRGTMEAADVLYGVTMQENGISKLLMLDMETMDAALIR